MINEFVIFFVLLIVTAALLRVDFAFTILYLFGGAYIFGRIWNRYAIGRITIKRSHELRAFLGEDIPVRLVIKNAGFLPVVWLRIHESVPIQLGQARSIKQILSLAPRGQSEISYNLHARRRGLYPVGPLFASSNDLIGLTGEVNLESQSDTLTVYPYIVPLTKVSLPSRSPLGTLRHTQPIFEDPARMLSKRDYVAGDSLRRVDWKASAVIGRLQVKQYEPSIALETAILLNLNSSEYGFQHRIDSTELGIVIAASLANWLVSQKQSVGLMTNGYDPSSSGGEVQPISPRKGRSHLMRILDALARAQMSDQTGFVTMVRQQSTHLPWGTTLVLITGQAEEALFDELVQAQRRGQNVMLIQVGRGSNVRETKHRAERSAVTFYSITDERDLELWRQ